MSSVRQMSTRERAWVTIGLILGFYSLALIAAGWLIAFPILRWSAGNPLNPGQTGFMLCAALGLLASVFPRADKFTPPGPMLERAQQPKLFAEIDAIAARMNQAPPEEVYLVPDMNAFVAERGGTLGRGSRRVMGIGLPLLQMLTITQLRAVLGHEFGHYAGDDTRWGPWLYKAREDMIRTVESLEPGTLGWALVNWYGRLFMWITQAFSREQEYAADLWAANLFGRKAIAEGLQAVEWGARCFDLYWQTEVGPMVDQGRLPPVSEGFARFGGSTVACRVMNEPAPPREADPFDSHPMLEERLAALAGLPEGDAADDDPAALSLVAEPKALERQMLELIVPPETLEALKPLRWEDAGSEIFLPQWQQLQNTQSEALAGTTIGGLPKVVEDWGWFIHRFKNLPAELEPEEAQRIAIGVIGAAIGVQLDLRGWTVDALPGEEVTCSKDGLELKPFEAVRKLLMGETKAPEWKQRCAELGIAEIALGEGKTYGPREKKPMSGPRL
ncbi:MAG: M48 family metallopeptidase [Elusimicrobia bacterium]|nr:M48 family metallopeptidase [Elusimicrobiota bacterium]